MPKKEKKLLYKFLIFLTKVLFKPTSKIYGLENLPGEGTFILAANHIGVFDPLVITAALYKFIQKKLLPRDKKFYWIGSAGLKKKPYLFFLSKDAGYLQNTRRGILQCILLLRNGNPIGIFPEGIIERNEKKMREGKRGVAYMALRLGLPVVPVACWCPKTTSFFQGLMGLFLPKKIVFGKPIYFPSKNTLSFKKNLHLQEIQQSANSIMSEIARLKVDFKKGRSQ